MPTSAHAPPYSGALTRGALTHLRPLAGIERRRSFTIADLRHEFGITSRAIRFYEEAGLIAPPRRHGQRQYTAKDHARLQLIVRGRAVGLTIEAIRSILDAYDEAGLEAQTELALQIFHEQLERLAERRRTVEAGIAELKTAIAELEDQPPEPARP